MNPISLPDSAQQLGTNERRRASRTVLTALLLIASIGALIVAPLSTGDRELTAIRTLPGTEQQELYERTFETLQSACGEPRQVGELQEFCKHQSAFIRKFPQCDTACVALGKPFQRFPSR